MDIDLKRLQKLARVGVSAVITTSRSANLVRRGAAFSNATLSDVYEAVSVRWPLAVEAIVQLPPPPVSSTGRSGAKVVGKEMVPVGVPLGAVAANDTLYASPTCEGSGATLVIANVTPVTGRQHQCETDGRAGDRIETAADVDRVIGADAERDHETLTAESTQDRPCRASPKDGQARSRFVRRSWRSSTRVDVAVGADADREHGSARLRVPGGIGRAGARCAEARDPRPRKAADSREPAGGIERPVAECERVDNESADGFHAGSVAPSNR